MFAYIYRLDTSTSRSYIYRVLTYIGARCNKITLSRHVADKRMIRKLWSFCVLLSLVTVVPALENGLARTPPMGWLTWERFRCNIDCRSDPNNCISDSLFRNMTDIMVSEGYAAVGYEYVIMDDCWLDRQRDVRGHLRPDRQRFPYGIKNLADYIHSKGLKFGIYEDYGNLTCSGYPGVLGHLKADAFTFGAWSVDYVKLNGCNGNPYDMNIGFPEFGYYLNQTGRRMVYSCSWPVYQTYAGIQPNYAAVAITCNLWRNFGDIEDSWASVENIMDYFGDNQDLFVRNAGPGHWNDPDVLIIGNFGLSYDECKTQMAIWAILAAPLIMSVDLRTIQPEYKAILQNTKIIAVNQDPLGIQGRRVYKKNGIEIWIKPITPVYRNNYSYAIAFVNRRTDGIPMVMRIPLSDLGLKFSAGYLVQNLYDNINHGLRTPPSPISARINPSGVVVFRCDLNIERPVVTMT